MNNTKQRVPKLRFPEFEGGWRSVKLGEICAFTNGKAHEQSINKDGEYIVVNSKFISSDGLVRKYSKSEISPLYKDEIVMVMSDIPKGKALAKCFYIDESKKYTLNQRICSIRAGENINAGFLYRILNRNRYYLKYDSGVTQTNLKKSDVLNCPLYVSSEIEQNKIASFLTSVDSKIETLTKKKKLLEKYKKGMMQRLFSQEIRFKDDEGSEYPEWEEKRLGDVAKIYDGTHQTPKYVDEGVAFYSVEHLTANQFIKTKYISEDVFGRESKNKSIEKGDVLMTRIGDIGTSKYIDWDVRASYYVSLSLLKPCKCIEGEYLSYLVECASFQRELWKRTIHVAFPKKINLGEIGECKGDIPSIPEQIKIANLLSSIDRKIVLANEELEKTKEFKKGLLQKMFV